MRELKSKGHDHQAWQQFRGPGWTSHEDARQFVVLQGEMVLERRDVHLRHPIVNRPANEVAIGVEARRRPFDIRWTAAEFITHRASSTSAARARSAEIC
jgi:U3 small nucleolar RNA-associated protein 14